MDDIIHRLYEAYITWAGTIPDLKLITIIRLTLLFAVPTAIYYWAFISGRREGFGRFLASVLADGLILAIVIRVPHDVTARAWILTVCVLLLAYLPGVHPFFVYREAGRQKRLRTGLYVLMGILLLAGLLWS
ncbi:MAG: hypothetical protein PHW60_03695 [Kiritimatiellae bacterium]|nr:hypothetical protein [Kiritimatiellia bacterium]